jgi:hypothetical protein
LHEVTMAPAPGDLPIVENLNSKTK